MPKDIFKANKNALSLNKLYACFSTFSYEKANTNTPIMTEQKPISSMRFVLTIEKKRFSM